MSGVTSTERVFTLSCFEGLRLLRKYMSTHPALSNQDLLNLILEIEVDAHSLDMESSIYLSGLVQKECPLDGRQFYQECIKAILLKHQPVWAKMMRQGRTRFFDKLNVNEQDVFTAAGLMVNPTPRIVVQWWDSVSGYARLFTDKGKMEQGREAEILSLQYERNRLSEIGIDLEPEWPGFDDNFAGYDVLSYDHSSTGITNKLIEVKSTTLSPMRFMLTRNEWEKAERAGNAYIFHIWDMNQSTPKLHIRSQSDVAPHIPKDNGNGKWNLTEVRVQTH